MKELQVHEAMWRRVNVQKSLRRIARQTLGREHLVPEGPCLRDHGWSVRPSPYREEICLPIVRLTRGIMQMIRKGLKWLGIVCVALIVIFGGLLGYRVLTIDDRNEQVAQDIRDNPGGARAQRAMLIYLPDGRMYPVNYLHEGELVFMGIDGLWWRSFRGDGAEVEMLIQGQTYRGHGKVVLDDPEYVRDIFARLRPTVPKWLPDWLNGKLVVITLQE